MRQRASAGAPLRITMDSISNNGEAQQFSGQATL
jgi:hypothetical protein